MLEKFSPIVRLRITRIQCNSIHTCWQFWSDITEPSHVWPNIKDKVIKPIHIYVRAYTYGNTLHLLPHCQRWRVFWWSHIHRLHFNVLFNQQSPQSFHFLLQLKQTHVG